MRRWRTLHHHLSILVFQLSKLAKYISTPAYSDAINELPKPFVLKSYACAFEEYRIACFCFSCLIPLKRRIQNQNPTPGQYVLSLSFRTDIVDM